MEKTTSEPPRPKVRSTILTIRRKEFISEFKSKYGTANGSSQDVLNMWTKNLYNFLHEKDGVISRNDVNRWIKIHSWIKNPGDCTVRKNMYNRARNSRYLYGYGYAHNYGINTTQPADSSTSMPSPVRLSNRIIPNPHSGTNQTFIVDPVLPCSQSLGSNRQPEKPSETWNNGEDGEDNDAASIGTIRRPIPIFRATPSPDVNWCGVNLRQPTSRSLNFENSQQFFHSDNQPTLMTFQTAFNPQTSARTENITTERERPYYWRSVDTSRNPGTLHTSSQPFTTTDPPTGVPTSYGSSQRFSQQNTDPLNVQNFPFANQSQPNATNSMESGVGDGPNLEILIKAESHITSLNGIIQKFPQLYSGLIPLANLTRQMLRMRRKIIFPKTYAEAHKETMMKMKYERINSTREEQGEFGEDSTPATVSSVNLTAESADPDKDEGAIVPEVSDVTVDTAEADDEDMILNVG